MRGFLRTHAGSLMILCVEFSSFGCPGLLLPAWFQLTVVCASLVLTTRVSCRELSVTHTERSGQQ